MKESKLNIRVFKWFEKVLYDNLIIGMLWLVIMNKNDWVIFIIYIVSDIVRF